MRDGPHLRHELGEAATLAAVGARVALAHVQREGWLVRAQSQRGALPLQLVAQRGVGPREKVQRLREEPEAAVPRVAPRQPAEYRRLVGARRKVRGQHARAAATGLTARVRGAVARGLHPRSHGGGELLERAQRSRLLGRHRVGRAGAKPQTNKMAPQ